MAVTIGTLPKGAIGYKMSGSRMWDPGIALARADNARPWSGIYVAPSQATARGYAVDCLDDQGNGRAHLQRVSLLSPLKLLTCDDPTIGESQRTGAEKAELVRQQLPADLASQIGSMPLMPALGRLGYALRCRHDMEGGEEIIVPNGLSAFVWMVCIDHRDYRGGMEARRRPA